MAKQAVKSDTGRGRGVGRGPVCTNSPLLFEAYLQPCKQKAVQTALQRSIAEVFPLEL